jgi:hypothetical protein
MTALPPPGAGSSDHDLSVAILAALDPELSGTIPSDREQSHTSIADGIYAHWSAYPGESLQVYDSRTRCGLLWLPSGQALETVRSRPALPIFHAHADLTGWVPAHGAAVGREGQFVLLAGPSQSGKSTAAIACAAAGWDYAGDDFVMVEPESKRVEPIYASGRLRPGAVGLLADFVQRTQIAVTRDFGEPRHEIRLGGNYTSNIIAGGRIAAILLPRRSGANELSIRPARPHEVFRALIGVTMLQLPGLHNRVTPKLLKLTQGLPAFVVETGDRPSRIPAAFERFVTVNHSRAAAGAGR